MLALVFSIAIGGGRPLLGGGGSSGSGHRLLALVLIGGWWRSVGLRGGFPGPQGGLGLLPPHKSMVVVMAVLGSLFWRLPRVVGLACRLYICSAGRRGLLP